MVHAKLSALKLTRLHEYLERFIFGGTATVLAALVANHFGPVYGGLFLAFPAIFPATVTLIESHEKKRMARIGHDGASRGRLAASLNASGAMLGSIGLAGFGIVLWRLLPHSNAWLALLAALAAWLILSIALWQLSKSRICGFRLRALR